MTMGLTYGASKIGTAQRAVDKLNKQAAALDSIH